MLHAINKWIHCRINKTSNTAGSMSRFSHFHGFSNLDGIGGMVIVAGVGFQPPASTSGHQTPVVTGVYVATVVDESAIPRHATTTVDESATPSHATTTVDESATPSHATTTVHEPIYIQQNGAVFAYSHQDDRDGTTEDVGQVTVCEERDGQQRILARKVLKLPIDQLKPTRAYLMEHNNSKHKILVNKGDIVQDMRKMDFRERETPHDQNLSYTGTPLPYNHTLVYTGIEENCPFAANNNCMFY